MRDTVYFTLPTIYQVVTFYANQPAHQCESNAGHVTTIFKYYNMVNVMGIIPDFEWFLI